MTDYRGPTRSGLLDGVGYIFSKLISELHKIRENVHSADVSAYNSLKYSVKSRHLMASFDY